MDIGSVSENSDIFIYDACEAKSFKRPRAHKVYNKVYSQSVRVLR